MALAVRSAQSAILVFALFFGSVDMALGQSAESPAVRQLEKALTAMADGDLNLRGNPAAEAYISEVGRAALGTSRQLDVDGVNYEREMDEAGLDLVLDPIALGADPTLAIAKTRLARLKAVVAKYRALALQRVDEGRAALARIEGPAGLRRPMLQGYDERSRMSVSDLKVMWDCEAAVIDEISEIVSLLVRSKGHWRIQDGELEIDRDADLKAIQARFNRMDQLGAKQNAVRAAAEKRALESAAGLNKYID